MHPALYLNISLLFNKVFTAFLNLASIKRSISINAEIHLILYLSIPGSEHQKQGIARALGTAGVHRKVGVQSDCTPCTHFSL